MDRATDCELCANRAAPVSYWRQGKFATAVSRRSSGIVSAFANCGRLPRVRLEPGAGARRAEEAQPGAYLCPDLRVRFALSYPDQCFVGLGVEEPENNRPLHRRRRGCECRIHRGELLDTAGIAECGNC